MLLHALNNASAIGGVGTKKKNLSPIWHERKSLLIHVDCRLFVSITEDGFLPESV